MPDLLHSCASEINKSFYFLKGRASRDRDQHHGSMAKSSPLMCQDHRSGSIHIMAVQLPFQCLAYGLGKQSFFLFILILHQHGRLGRSSWLRISSALAAAGTWALNKLIKTALVISPSLWNSQSLKKKNCIFMWVVVAQAMCEALMNCAFKMCLLHLNYTSQ